MAANITWDVEEGQLVRLFHNRPETAWQLEDAPREEMIAALVWNDPNGCYTDADSIAEFGRVATDDELRAVLAGWAGA